MHYILYLLSLWIAYDLSVADQAACEPGRCFICLPEHASTQKTVVQDLKEIVDQIMSLTREDTETKRKNIKDFLASISSFPNINAEEWKNNLSAIADNLNVVQSIDEAKINDVAEILKTLNGSNEIPQKKLAEVKKIMSELNTTNDEATLNSLKETGAMLTEATKAKGTLDKLNNSLIALNGAVGDQSRSFSSSLNGVKDATSTSTAAITAKQLEIMKSLQSQMDRLEEQEKELTRGVNIAVTCLTFLLIGIIATGAFVVFVVVLAIKNMPSGRPNPDDLLSFSEAPGTSGASKNKTSSSAAKTTSTGKITSSAKISDKPSTSGEPSTSVKPTNAHQMKVFSTSTKIA